VDRNLISSFLCFFDANCHKICHFTVSSTPLSLCYLICYRADVLRLFAGIILMKFKNFNMPPVFFGHLNKNAEIERIG
jgi:hypothetical protein